MSLGTILLPYDGGESANAMLRMACGMIGERGRLIVLYATRIPTTLPLDPLPRWIDDQGNDMLDRAELIASTYGIEIETVLTRARRPVHAIIAEARACETDAIFLARCSWRHPWRRLHAAFTERAVVRQAPCPVLVGNWVGDASRPTARQASEDAPSHAGAYSVMHG